MEVLFLFYTATSLSATAKPARGKGVRSTGAPGATNPCGAAGASGIAATRISFFSSPCAKDRHPKGRDALLSGSGHA